MVSRFQHFEDFQFVKFFVNFDGVNKEINQSFLKLEIFELNLTNLDLSGGGLY